MSNKKIKLSFRVTEKEYQKICEKLEQSKQKSMSEYLRKIAVNGLIIYYDAPTIIKLSKSIAGIQNNINQIARRINSTSRVYDEDLKYIKKSCNTIAELQEKIEIDFNKIFN